MNNKFYVKKFVRDDGAILELDGIEIYLDAENTLLVRPDPNTTAVSYTEANGGEMIRQRLDVAEQPINGLILPKSSTYWQLVQKLTGFWKINHTYRIIYIKRDGGMFVINSVWIGGALQIIPTSYEQYSRWNIVLNIGNELWTEYAEDATGKEIYANSYILPSLASSAGGEQWDDVGEVYDEVGAVWQSDSTSGLQSVDFNSIKPVYPVWTVLGPCTNPKLQNNTTDTEAIYNGTIGAGQTLVVDFSAGEARLDGALVTRFVDGVVYSSPGENIMGFSSDDGLTKNSVISWNNIIG